jgi:hypothetical protein
MPIKMTWGVEEEATETTEANRVDLGQQTKSS